ncbi:hypothetical protein HS088_TW10G00693 [Tripterygium wilfordii]|uniref:Pentatricopeptide repeat-containing protein n=1 Tax=Tripterygium wilfordii TaxID=458696 RepID=A0A7J7D5Z1_TRIWF|nr:hypothetical protein HS088_TW10G00693 [Tripterygium wilfordii]
MDLIPYEGRSSWILLKPSNGCGSDFKFWLDSGMVGAGMIDEAHSLFRTIKENGCSADLNSLNIILNGLAKIGGPKQTMEMLKMKHCNVNMKSDVVSYNTVLGCLTNPRAVFTASRKQTRENISNAQNR